MCGIAGKVLWSESGQAVSDRLLEDMIASVRYRGPDDQGWYVAPDGRAGIGMSRLAIIDLVTGHQPIANEDESVWVVLNGEIYNYQALRETLSDRHRFVTQSDTEVLVHLYEEHGPAFVEHLRGMFALAVWDTRNRRLVLARDRLGQKPLYVAHDPSARTVVFGSEIRVLLADPAVSRELDPLALDEYLTYGFVPAPRSIYRSIRKLPPASVAVFDPDEARTQRYWTVDYGRSDPMSEEQAVDRLEDLLTESVRLRLISDVPLGSFLSGGIDSSVITALAARLTGAGFRTFTVGFDASGYDETPHARRVANLCGTDHREQTVEWDVREIVPRVAYHFDEPFGDSSAVPTFHVCRMAREHVTVCLSGDGGDELLAGYNRYQAQKLVDLYMRVPRLLQPQWLERMVRARPTSADYFGANWLKSLQYLIEFAEGVRRRGWQSWLRYFDDEERHHLLTDGWRQRIRDARASQAAPVADGIDALARQAQAARGAHCPMWLDLMTYLPDDILTKVDRMSMAVSLECRSPLLDHRLVEWLARVPLRLKLRGLTRKYLLRRLADRLFPRGMFNRRKQGFMMPLAVWFQKDLGDWVANRLAENHSFGRVIRMPVVRELLEAHRRQAGDHSYRLWALLMLGEFLRQREDGSAGPQG